MCWEMIEGQRYKSTETTSWSHTCSIARLDQLTAPAFFREWILEGCFSGNIFKEQVSLKWVIWSCWAIIQYWLGLCLLGYEFDYTVGGWVCIWQAGRDWEKRQSVICYSPPTFSVGYVSKFRAAPKQTAGMLLKERKREENYKMNK